MWPSEEAYSSWLFSEASFNEMYGDSSSSSESEDDEPRQMAVRSKKAHYAVEDRFTSIFYKTYLSQSALDDRIEDDTSWLGKKFRRRFRVPYSVFREICQDINRVMGERRCTDRSGSPTVPVDVLILGSLRVLGSGCTFDAIEELTCVHEETHRLFFHNQFCKWGERVSTDKIRMPSTEEELRHVLGLYERVGFPGCVGSVDCVHVVWDRCPAGVHSSCKGKDKIPTLAFQVICDHTKRITSVSQFFWGTVNDKTIAMADEVFRFLRTEGNPISDLKWTVVKDREDGDPDCASNVNDNSIEQTRTYYNIIRQTANNIILEFTGAYLISDGGYHRWPCLVNPYHLQPPGTDLKVWSSNLESIRKDIECVFGILKKRFLYLKHPIRIHSPYCIQRVFVTCCVLHNILLDYDGFEVWNENNVENSVEYNVLERSASLRAQQSRNCQGMAGVRSLNRSTYGVQDNNSEEFDVIPDDEEKYHCRRFNLIKHFKRMLRFRMVHMNT